MAYTSQSHLSGAVITAAHAENWETQYSQMKATYLDKFSTASTGTTLLSCASTYSVPTIVVSTAMHFLIPPGIQKSRFEFSMTGKWSTAIAGSGTVGCVYLTRGFLNSTAAPSTNLVTFAASILSSWSTAAAGVVKTTGFTAIGGEWLTLSIYNASSTDFTFWNVKISGTSTTITDNSSLIFQWTTNPYGIPSSTG